MSSVPTPSNPYPDLELNDAERQYPLPPSLLDARHYSDPDQYQRELEQIFFRSWFPVCPSSDLAAPRDFVVWDRLEQSIVIARRDDGSVSAWHNVCQHRGAKLISESGHCKTGRFKCPWHGFAYNLDGKVTGVPMKELFDPAELADLRESLGDLHDELAWYGLDGFETRYRTEIKLKANWKLVIDAFNETWHVPFTHTDTLAGMMLWRDAVLKLAPPHSWMTLPVRGFSEIAQPGADHRETHLCHYTVFPNTIFSCFPTHLQMWSVWPLSPTETILSAWGVVGPTPERLTDEKWAARNDRDWEHFLHVVKEDCEVIDEAGTLSASLGFRRNMFCTAEGRLTAFHEEVNRRIG